MTQRHTRGFTLIEVMIVVVIVAILAAVAVPSYQSQIQKTRRADAKEALTRAAAAQERWFFSHNEYTNDLKNLGFEGGTSVDGHYTLTLNRDTATTYTITATAAGAQEKDIACPRFKIDQSGLKTAEKGPSGSGVDNTAECWR